MKLSKRLPGHLYVVLAGILKREMPRYINNDRVIERLAHYGETTKQAVKAALSPAHGPSVSAKLMHNGFCAEYHFEQRTIYFHVRLVAALEASKGQAQLLRGMIAPILLHELVHYFYISEKGRDWRRHTELPQRLKRKLSKHPEELAKANSGARYDFGAFFDIDTFGHAVCRQFAGTWQLAADNILRRHYPEAYNPRIHDGLGMPESFIQKYEESQQ